MKSGSETVKQNLSVLRICCGLWLCASAAHRPWEILPIQGWRALAGAATCHILLPSAGTRNVCDVGFPLQKQWNFVPEEEIPTSVLYRHLSPVSGKKWFQSYIRKTGRNTMICTVFTTQRLLPEYLAQPLLSVAVRRAHEKEEEMETEPAFTLCLFLELFICHICIWSSQCLHSWAKTKLKSWNNWHWW